MAISYSTIYKDLTLESLEGGGGGGGVKFSDHHPLDFCGFKFSLLD